MPHKERRSFTRIIGFNSAEPSPSEPIPSSFQYISEAHIPKWGTRSHWKQPWRSYLDTVPGTQLLNMIGINANENTNQHSSVLRLLGSNGFRRARIEYGWNSIVYSETEGKPTPTKMTSSAESTLKQRIELMKTWGIRPLVLFNANHGDPCPSVNVTNIELTAEAALGATKIHINPSAVSQIKLGRTGITGTGKSGNPKAFYMFKAVTESGEVTLSQPLQVTIPAGKITNVWTLLYEPWHLPALNDTETPNPKFESTMLGWLKYVEIICAKVKEVLGSEEFDIETWNEVGFGSNFLNINNYYKPALETYIKAGPSSGTQIWARTLAFMRDPKNGFTNVGQTNGFTNQNNGCTGGPGATANSRHPYPGRAVYPAFDANGFEGGSPPLDANNKPCGVKNAAGQYIAKFIPEYIHWMPEHKCTQLQTECDIFFISPYRLSVGGESQGRSVPPSQPPQPREGGLLPPEKYSGSTLSSAPIQCWLTETNVGNWKAGTVNPTAADKRHLETKVVLRDIAMYGNKGLRGLYFYDVGTGKGDDLDLVDVSFFNAIAANPAVYPGDSAGGETISSVGHFTAAFSGSVELTKPRSLELHDLTQYSENLQFKGTHAFDKEGFSFPDLMNRDVFAFLPFQINDGGKFVIATYVVTHNVAHEYAPEGGPTRFDLPEEKYRMYIRGLKGTKAIVSATDPITNKAVTVTTVSASSSELVLDIWVTDYPRLVTIQEVA